MRHAVVVDFRHTEEEFWTHYRASTCAVERRRLQVLALLAAGRSRAEVLAITRYSVPSLIAVLHRYTASGLDGLRDRRHHNCGAPTLLSDSELQQLAEAVQADYAREIIWSGVQVQAWIKSQLGKELYLSRAYEFLDAIGFSQQTARPRHVAADEAAQEAFKKRSSPTVSAQLRRVMARLNSGAWTSTDSA